MHGGPPGVISLVKRGSHREVFKHGVANVSAHEPIGLRDRLRIASVSKAFSGATALSLVAHARLGLDDTIAERLPELPAAWGSVTLGEALQHTSGLPDFTKAPAFDRYAKKHPRRPVEPSMLISYVADQPLAFTPGSQYLYSDTDNIVVGLFVEQATQLSYERVLSQRVLDRLRLRQTSMPPGFRMPGPYVHGYGFSAKGAPTDQSEDFSATLAWASGGMVSSPLNLTRFIRAYGGGRLFGGATRSAQLQFRPGDSDPPGPGVNSAGLAIFRYQTRCGTVYGHTGDIEGYTNFIATTPNGRRSVTIQATTQLDSTTGTHRAFRALHHTFNLGVCAALAGGRR